MPRLFSIVQVRAGFAAALAAAAAAPAFGQTLNDLELRPAVSQDAPVRTAQQPPLASPPGSGAGDTGFNSTNPPPDVQEDAAPPRPAGNLASRVRQAIGGDRAEITGSVPPVIRRRPVEEEPYAPAGVRIGSFDVRSMLDIYGGYDNNPFRTTTGALPSKFTRTEGRIDAKSNWSRHELSAELRGSYEDYLDVPGNDRPEGEARLRGRIDVTSQGRIELEGRAALATDAAGTPDAITSAKQPPHIYTFEGIAGYFHRFNRLELGLRGGIERRKHQDAELLSGARLDLSDRDYTSYGLALRGSYDWTPAVKPFVEAGVDRRVYDHRFDFGGVQRGSDGTYARAGMEFARDQVLSGEISAGYAWRKYEDPTLDPVSGLIFDASLIWRATGLTTVSLRGTSEIGETSLAGASGVLYRRAAVTIDHAFRRWLIGTAEIAYGIDDYQGAGRRDDRLGLSAGLTYYFNRHMALKGEVRHERLRSDAPDVDYTANIFMLGLRFQR